LAAGQLAWQPSDYVSQNEARKPAVERTRYQVCEVRHDIVDTETDARYPVRWIFSHSSTKAALDLRHREEALAEGEAALRRIVGLLGKYDYTRQAVIEQRLEQALRKVQAHAYFGYTLTGNDKIGDWHLRWRRLPKAIKTEAAFDGVALLCTNVPAAEWSAATVMSKYKQQVLAEQAIDFIKSPVQIRPMWLHQPKRLAGLTLVVMLAVLLAALLELQVRRWLAKHGQSLTGLRPGKRRTTMPTAEALLQAIADYTLVIVRRARSDEEVHLPQLRPLQQQIWKALQLPPIAELAASTPVTG
jgi:transposase